MALIVCKECKGSVSTTAAACPHCGATVKKKSSGCGLFILLGTILFFAIVIIGGTADQPAGQAKTTRTLKVSISVTGTELRLKNLGSSDWTEAVVYINGTPPFTYKQTVTAPAVGQAVAMPLIEFVNRDGDRFNPFTKAVREVWVGGSGYDYEKYNVGR